MTLVKIISLWLITSGAAVLFYFLGFAKGYNQREKDEEDEKHFSIGL
jgi:hypothetical protein